MKIKYQKEIKYYKVLIMRAEEMKLWKAEAAGIYNLYYGVTSSSMDPYVEGYTRIYWTAAYNDMMKADMLCSHQNIVMANQSMIVSFAS